jgi:hypothetical protein
VASSDTGIVVLANGIDYNLSFDFFAYFVDQGHNVTRASISNFDALKTEPLVVILGGPDAPDGVGDIVDGLLEESDKEFLRASSGNKALYVKNDVWKTPQTVLILAGNNRQDTHKISMEKRAEVVNRTTGIEEGAEETEEQTNIILTLEDETHGWSSNNGYIKNIIYTMNNKGTTTIDAVADLIVYELPSMIEAYAGSDVAPRWNESFSPNMNRYANISEKITLSKKGSYKIVLRIRDGTSSEILASDSKEISLG